MTALCSAIYHTEQLSAGGPSRCCARLLSLRTFLKVESTIGVSDGSVLMPVLFTTSLRLTLWMLL
jgi:hypothetical protein